MGPAGAVVEDEAADLVAHLGQRGGGRAAGQAGPDDDHLVLPLVGGVDEPDVGLVAAPLAGQLARGDPGVEDGHGAT